MTPLHVWFLDTVHSGLHEQLAEAGMICHDGTSLDRTDLIRQAASPESPVHGLVLRSRLQLDEGLLRALPDLQWIARSGSGLENIDLSTAVSLNIEVFSSPEGNRDAVGEHVVGMLLNVLHKLRSSDESVRRKEWNREQHRGRELSAMTVGIMGYGHMGSAVAERLMGFGCRVMAYDKYKSGWGEHPDVERPLAHVEPVGWKDFCESVDVVSLHLPWTEETRGMADDAWFGQFSKPILLINSSRGPIVRTQPLLTALASGRVTHACLDVLEHEGRSLELLEFGSNVDERAAFETLLGHPNVLLSPHVAGWTVESYRKLSTVLADKILGRH